MHRFYSGKGDFILKIKDIKILEKEDTLVVIPQYEDGIKISENYLYKLGMAISDSRKKGGILILPDMEVYILKDGSKVLLKDEINGN